MTNIDRLIKLALLLYLMECRGEEYEAAEQQHAIAVAVLAAAGAATGAVGGKGKRRTAIRIERATGGWRRSTMAGYLNSPHMQVWNTNLFRVTETTFTQSANGWLPSR